MFHLFGIPVLGFLRGKELVPRFLPLPISQDCERKKAIRLEFLPCRLTPAAEVQPLQYHGSAHLAALVDADGFFVLEPGVYRVSRGDPVPFWPTSIKTYHSNHD